MRRLDYWPDDDEEPPSETALLIHRIASELRAELDPEGMREWQAMVVSVFGAARRKREGSKMTTDRHIPGKP